MSLIDNIGDFFNDCYDAISSAMREFIKMVKGLVKTIVTAIVNFNNQIRNWFKNLSLIKGRHIPFLSQQSDFRTMLKNAPKKNVGIFEGVYDEQTDEITELQYIAADSLDTQTQKILQNEPIVVLE